MERDSAEENDPCNAVLRYINHLLMEDDLEEDKAFMIHDSNLHAAEKSLSEILNQKDPPSCNQHLPREDTSSSSDDSITHYWSNFGNSNINAYISADSALMGYLHEHNPSVDDTLPTNPLSFFPPSCSSDTFDGLMESLVNVPLENQSSWPFGGGAEEIKNTLPSGDGGISDFPPKTKEKVLEAEKDEGHSPENMQRGRKSVHREGSDLEEGMRTNKHFVVSPDESVLHEMFAKVLNLYDGNDANEANKESQQNERAKGSNMDLAYPRKGAIKREAIDMRSLLTQCTQSMANNDHRSTNNLLNQIRRRSSPSGDGTQRLAHYFANSLEARFLGNGRLPYKAISALSDTQVLRGYKLYLTSFPFMETSYFFSAQMIMDLAEKADTIHIIHFGISSGLQWLPLIQRLSTMPCRPPKLRITGIDLPQPGFRPDAMVKETGLRLANYCERFNVPFEYIGIAQKWETISVEDLEIEKDEAVVVNCLYQFMYLLDDSSMEHSPRDRVLNLIKMINPDIFIHGIVNGAFNSPFFISRFRKALFFFSALFDMFEANVARENQERMVFEREVLGSQILNIVACEGLERVERAETYKQWQILTMRAGFKKIPLSQEIMKKVKAKVKNCYHKDFFVDEGSQWMLKGWKGRVLYALSCWKPA